MTVRRFLFAMLLLLGAPLSRAGENAQVLVVGNSLSYVNDLQIGRASCRERV